MFRESRNQPIHIWFGSKDQKPPENRSPWRVENILEPDHARSRVKPRRRCRTRGVRASDAHSGSERRIIEDDWTRVPFGDRLVERCEVAKGVTALFAPTNSLCPHSPALSTAVELASCTMIESRDAPEISTSNAQSRSRLGWVPRVRRAN